MKKVIFLDMDGVMNNHASIANGIHFDQRCAGHLNDIIDKTEADIVISSTWRHNTLAETFNTLFWTGGGPYNAVIGMTKRISGIRGNEIKDWVDRWKIGHPKEELRYVILDDDSDMTDHQKEDHFVQINMQYGLTSHTAEKVIDILNGIKNGNE